MISYFKMKHTEWKIKKRIYEMILFILDEQKDIVKLINNMYAALKDVPFEDLQKEFLSNLAVEIHSGNYSI